MKRFYVLFATLLALNVCGPPVMYAQEGDVVPVDADQVPDDAEAADAVVIIDIHLASAIRSTLGLATDATLTATDMLDLRNLEAKKAEISDLSGLEHATNLTTLNLYGNQLTNISPLSRLEGLLSLDLGKNTITDIEPLKALTALTTLYLDRNPIIDFRPLSSLTNLGVLHLSRTGIRDLSALGSLTQLTQLYLTGNAISDIGALSTLTEMGWLFLAQNQISNVSPLADMEALVSLRLLENPVSNASVLYGLTQGSLIDVDIEILPPADTEPPSVTIAVPADTQNGAFEVVITFTESVSGFEQADITLSGTATASLTAWSTTDDTVFTATLTPTTSGDVVVSVIADVATDAAGNNNTASDSETVTVDMDAPSVSISVPAGVQNTAFDVVITFTERVSGFEQSDVTLSGTAVASIAAWSTTGDTVFTATITPTTSGEVVVSVIADLAMDAASNNNTASDPQTVTVDMDAPRVSISVPEGVQNTAFDVVITFTEVVSGFEQADLSVSGTAAATVTAWSTTDEATYTATITPTTSGDVVVSVIADVATDAAGNNNTASDSQTVTVDMTPPEVSISVPTGVQNTAFDVVITFTESVSGFEQADVTLSGTATASITAWSTTDDRVWTATITPTTSGTLTLSIPADVAMDAVGNNNTASDSETVTIDMDAPSVSISVPTGVQNSTFDVVITFTEVVSGFEQADLMLSGTATASITAWQGTDDRVWTATLTPTTSGTLTLSIAEGAVIDTAGNTNVLSTAEVSITLNVPDDTASVFVSVCDRTPQVRDAIVEAVSGVSDCADVTAADLATITLIDLRHDITALKEDDFNGLTALETLWLVGNDLSSLPADIFDDLTALETLVLWNNGLRSLPAGIFDGLTALETLWLIGNDLSSLPDGIFDDLTALENLKLWHNGLRSLPAGIFDGLTALETLRLDFNKLSSLPDGIFDDLTALENLKLWDNGLRSLPAGIFDDLTALETLVLSQNKLSSLPADIFDNLTALETLVLSQNKLSSLPADIFDDLTALEGLGLSQNKLSRLPDGIFDKLTALESLHLNNNALSSLPDGIFDKLTALKRLRLDGNTVDPLPVTVSLEQVGEGELKATAPTGAPFDIVLPLTVTHGSIADGGTPSITIFTGKVESESVTVTRTPGTVDAVWVDIGTLPDPGNLLIHWGYELVKSSDLPLTVIDELGNAAPSIASVVVLPDETMLSANYPNPFNPETWIPYQLANPSDVVISIYDGRGRVVRRLELGHLPPGYYTSRSRAAYWDGRNDFGERVSSGLYFYHLRADNMSLLRKMLILK